MKKILKKLNTKKIKNIKTTYVKKKKIIFNRKPVTIKLLGKCLSIWRKS